MLIKMIKKIDHFVITTKNIDTCLNFYQKLGFTVNKEMGRYQLYQESFKINVHILGKELLPHAKNIQIGSVDICFELSTDIKNFVQYLNDNAIIIEEGIVNRIGTYGNMQSVYIRDPDGNLLEFCQYY